MADTLTEEKQTTEQTPEAQPDGGKSAADTQPAAQATQSTGARKDAGGESSRGARSRKPRERTRRQRKPRERSRPEFDQKIIGIRRVTRVVAGGRRFSFSVSVVIGNRRGQVGVGLGKAADTALAIEKATKDARKNLMTVNLDEDMTVPHEAFGKYASSEVIMMPAPGKGLRAGASVRTVLEHAGVKDVSAKILTRSKNRLNNARAAIVALKNYAS